MASNSRDKHRRKSFIIHEPSGLNCFHAKNRSNQKGKWLIPAAFQGFRCIENAFRQQSIRNFPHENFIYYIECFGEKLERRLFFKLNIPW